MYKSTGKRFKITPTVVHVYDRHALFDVDDYYISYVYDSKKRGRQGISIKNEITNLLS